MGVQLLGPAALYFARKGVKGYIKYKNIYTNPDKHTLKTEKKYLGKKVNKGYISKKTDLIPKKRNGGSIKVKCKLGRNRPTKLM
jgi:hypothetical protein